MARKPRIINTMEHRIKWLSDWLEMRNYILRDEREVFLCIMYSTAKAYMGDKAAQEETLRINYSLTLPFSREKLQKHIFDSIKKNADLEKGDFNMKKILCALLVGILLVGLAACSKSPTAPQSVDNPNATNSSPVITPIGKGETGISEVPTEDPIESISQLLSYSIYVPNDNANGFVVETVSTADISAETVLTELKKRNVWKLWYNIKI